MQCVLVRIAVTPRLLADLLAAVLCTDQPLQRWWPGDDPPIVEVVESGAEERSQARVTVALGRLRDDPIQVSVDGRRRELEPTPPERLHEVVVALLREVAVG